MPLLRRHIIPISGKDSLCTALVQLACRSDLPYEFVFCDVRMELPETYAWLTDVERKLGIRINRVGKSLVDVITEANMLPSHQRRFCTKYGKIFPIEDYIGKDPAVQYIGFRADENRVGKGAFSRPNVEFSYPLQEAGIDLRGVYAILGAKGLMPPKFFWKRLWDAVWETCSETSQRFMDDLPEWSRDVLFSWRSRSNCFMCFYQRLYEWVGLLDHHPDLFAQAEQIEFDFGNVASPNGIEVQRNFYFNQDWPLAVIRKFASEDIFRKRVDKVRNLITRMRHSDDDLDLLATTSCGAYCGK